MKSPVITKGAAIMVALCAFLLSVVRADDDARRQSRETSVVRVFRQASPAVVNIRVRGERIERDPFFSSPFGSLFPEFGGFGFRREFQSLGTGFVIDGRGHLLTNAHVVERATQIVVKLADDREFPAELVGADSDRDLAVLKIDAPVQLPAVTLGRADDLMIGETVIAIGNPFGLSHTLSTGVLSAVGRTIQARDKSFYNFLQTDAPINPGNSGGPLLNILGEVIGVNTAVHGEAQGIGFAIPIDDARRVFDDLIAFGQVIEPWIGLQMQELTPELAEALGHDGRGAIVVDVVKGSPAEAAGFRSRDIVVSLAGKPVRNLNDYTAIMRSLTGGQVTPARIVREGKPADIRLKPVVMTLAEAGRVFAERTGLVVEDIPAALRRRNPKLAGVSVRSVARGSPAERIGFQPGDIVFRINNRPVPDLKGLQELLRGSLNRSSVYVHGARGNQLFGVVLPLG